MFYVVKSESQLKSKGIYLKYDNWDDFDYKTTFEVLYYSGNAKYSLGRTKIARREYYKTKITYDYLDRSFKELSNDFFSLGQEVDFYKKINDLDDKLEEGLKESIYKGLNDIAYNNDLYYMNIENDALKTSLLRWISPTSITGQFHRISLGGIDLTEYYFTFDYETFEKYIKLEFQVDPDSIIPSNIHAIIGRNGSGKTYLIKEMIKSLSLYTSKVKKIKGENRNNKFYEIFSKVMCVSYSFFDSVSNVINPEESIIEYEFWGISRSVNSSQKIELIDFESEFDRSIVNCFKLKSKRQLWIEAINILEIDEEVGNETISNLKYANYNSHKEHVSLRERLNQLSSGHKSVLSMITKIIDIIEEKTLVIIDEPETHLHPPLLSNFIKALSYILKAKNGVSIIATHSPLIIREIPKTNCYIITRRGNNIRIERPYNETYGASINTIMKQSFKLESDISGFYENISDILEKNEKTKIVDLKSNLGDEALAYLNLLEYLKNEKDI